MAEGLHAGVLGTDEQVSLRRLPTLQLHRAALIAAEQARDADELRRFLAQLGLHQQEDP